MPDLRPHLLLRLMLVSSGVGLALVRVVPLAGHSLMTTPIGFRSGLTEGAVTTRPGTLTVDAGTSVRWTGRATTYRVGELNVRAPLSDRI